jgi:ElaB/YqjD/DUF883 family membrane-anchored ribosome-binding protein
MDTATPSAVERIGEELQHAKDNIGRSASATGDEIAAQIRRVQDDLNAIKDTIANFGKTSREEASGAASRIGAAAKDAAGEFAGNARQDAQSKIDAFEDYARKNPNHVLAGALGIGVLLGLLLGRK